MNQFLLSEINRKSKQPIDFTYDQLKDIVIFRATTSSYYWNKRHKSVACLYCLGTVGEKYTIPITLSEALSFLQTDPVMFNAQIISELYRYVSLYDKDIYDKLNGRNKKAKTSS